MDRRRWVLVGGVLVALVVLLAVGVVGGGLRGDGDGALRVWQQRLEGADPATVVDPGDLRAEGACSVDPGARELALQAGTCVVHVPEAGRFSVRGAARALRLVAVGSPVLLRTSTEGRPVEATLAPGDSSDPDEVAFGRDAQELVLVCPSAPCRVLLPS